MGPDCTVICLNWSHRHLWCTLKKLWPTGWYGIPFNLVCHTVTKQDLSDHLKWNNMCFNKINEIRLNNTAQINLSSFSREYWQSWWMTSRSTVVLLLQQLFVHFLKYFASLFISASYQAFFFFFPQNIKSFPHLMLTVERSTSVSQGPLKTDQEPVFTEIPRTSSFKIQDTEELRPLEKIGRNRTLQ